MVNIADAFVTLRPDVSNFGRETEAAVSRSLQSITGDLMRSGAVLTAGVTAPITAIGVTAVRSAMSFESAFTGVIKVIDATDEEIAGLRSGIIGMSKELPASAAQIADVAMAAGQLGIQTPNILEFSRVMIDLGEATNLSATDAATQLARLANITGMSQGDFDRLGSAVVELGNNLATTEAEIVQFGLRIAGAGTQIGLTEAQILAWGGALSSVGIEAEAGGTAISRVFIDIANAVANGGADLAKFANVAGVSAEAFADAFRNDASDAVLTFIQGLGDLSASGENVFGILDDLSLGNIRVRDALLRSSGAVDLLRQSLDLGAQGWEQNTALTREAELRYGTAESRLAMLRNQLTAVAITLGDALVPVMLSLVDGFSRVIPIIEQGARVFAALPGPVQATVAAVAALAALAGPALLAIGGMTAGYTALAGAVTAATGAQLGLNLAMLANPITAGVMVAGLAAAAVAARIFGDAMSDANDEVARALRISEQSKAETQEYIFDLKRREQAIREHIEAVEAAGIRNVAQGERLIALQNELKAVTEELQAQEAALQSMEKQERETAKQTKELEQQFADLMGELEGMAPATMAASAAQQFLATDFATAEESARFLEDAIRGVTQALIDQANETGVADQIMAEAERAASIAQMGWLGRQARRKAAQAGLEDVNNYVRVTRTATDETKKLTDAQREAERVANEEARAQEQLAAAIERGAQAMRQATMRDIDTLGRGLVTALQREQQGILDGALRGIERLRNDYLDYHNERLAQIQRERDTALDAIDEQIAALTQASRDDRLADLQRALLIAWDPRERERIEQQITEHLRQEEVTRLRNERAALEEGFRDRETAAENDLREQMKRFDDQEKAARDTYERMTDAWRLQSRARELLMSGEMERVTGLIETHLDEWPGLWQSMSDAVINGPLDNLAAAVRGVFAGIGALGGPAAAAAAGDPVIAAMQAQGHQMVAAGTNKAIIDMHRQALRDRGGFPTFDGGGVVPGPRGAPTLALVHGGETILPTHKGGMPAPVINLRVFLGDREIRDVVRVEVEDATARSAQRSGMEGGYGR